MKKRFNRKQIHPRLTAYSATAAAALTVAPAVHAEIRNITDGLSGNLLVGGSHTTPPVLNFLNVSHNMVVTAGPFKMSFNAFNSAHTFAGGYLEGGFSPFAAFLQPAMGGGRSVWYPKNLLAGHRVSTQGPFQGTASGNLLFLGGGGVKPANPEFQAVGANAQMTGYLGFKAVQGGHTYYGWLRLQEKNSSGGWPDRLALVDKSGDGIYGAYGLKGDQITVGATAVPEPSSFALSGLGLLALGAAGVRELRRQRGKQTASK